MEQWNKGRQHFKRRQGKTGRIYALTIDYRQSYALHSKYAPSYILSLILPPTPPILKCLQQDTNVIGVTTMPVDGGSRDGGSSFNFDKK